MAIKTLLVGLGGTGCEIVTRVRNLIHGADANVQFVGLDTDGNWGGVDGLPIIYTSREMAVKQYLRDVDNWQEWFPDNASIKQRSMIKGAGQVRALSRLAFEETISSNRIGVLRDAIKALKISRGEIEPSNFRIMIISSFAGGTGSGMFLQTALFLRDFIRKEYGGEVIIRGLFALPDIFMDYNPSAIQRESMYANAYASLKELNAMNLVTLSTDPTADEVNMTIDRLFDSKRDRGNAEKKPFDFIFFVDNVNSRSMVMSSQEEYKQLMTTAAYMQVYSPITDAGDSREDNAILTVISEDGKPLYGSVGASRIVYPYEDILDYCSKRATIESVTQIWTLIDKEFQTADEENKRMMEVDPTVKALDRGAHFRATMQTILESGNTRFLFVDRAINETGEDGSKLNLAESYFEAITSFITDKIGSDPEIVAKRDAAGVSEKQLKSDRIVQYVSKNETALKNYVDTVNDRIMLLRGSLVMSIIPDDLGKPLNADADWNIMSLFKRGDSVVHPLAVRLMLYHLRDQVREQYAESSSAAKNSIKSINNYFKEAYDLPKTEDIVESATYRASQRSGQRQFRADYLKLSDEQKNMITKYGNDKALSVVLGDVLIRLNALIRQFERLFDSLDDICGELGKEVEILEQKKHSNTADAAIYLCAKPADKQNLYESLNFNCSDSNENNVYGSIFYSLYQAAMEAVEKERGKVAVNKKNDRTRDEREKYVARMDELFRESILKRNRDDIEETCADKLDIDVFQALRKEAEDDKQRIRGIMDMAHEKALPYLLTNLSRKIVSLSEPGDGDEDSAYTMVFWGINPEVQKKIMSNQNLKDIRTFFKSGTAGFDPEVVADNEYSRHEISCYQALYCVSLTEIPKFAETGDEFGVYYENYTNRIKKMIKRDKLAITPHIDIRWHKRSFLPMISDAKNHKDDENTARAIWLALMYKGLPEERRDGKKCLYANFARVIGPLAKIEEKYPKCDILYKNRPVSLESPYELFKALQINEIISDRFIEVYTEAFEKDREQSTAKVEFTGPRARGYATSLISKDNTARNALNLVAKFVSHKQASEYEKNLFGNVLQMIIEEICCELPASRGKELRRAILSASRFAKDNAAREKVNRYINFDYWESQG